ncbi:GNAT family N-acetyltransferase [Chamaesiphon sp. VAR_48_metabat_403]|uniref:GNAT family N-acetyltransferase n=1 Tax=Chamaesiphon sp. VAR_48_metabat_403 TaxID=2964700 RepID=UPI00286E77A0|nr:GNAT family N-acetyltransferase [Chamaesiphon sp. VAR_48_metabat_403]
MSDFTARLCPGDPVSGVFGAFDDTNRPIGMLGFSRESRPKRAHIGNLWSMYVVPEFRNRGVGSALLDAALSHAKGLGVLRQIVLGVTASNLAASSLYKSRGFQPFGFERDALFVDGTYFDEEHLALHFDRDA